MLKKVVWVIAIALLTVVAMETVLKAPYNRAKSVASQLVSRLEKPLKHSQQSANMCALELIDRVPARSAVIIGHGYGAPDNHGQLLSPKVEKFLRLNAASLDTVIFSGDVFSESSASKWVWLEKLSQELGFDVQIAPGNHDVGVGDNSRRDVWKQTKFDFASSDVRTLEINGFSVILEDSVRTDWLMAPVVVDALRSLKSELPTLLVRHNIAVQEMVGLANSKVGASGELPSLATLSEKLPPDTIVVSGDSGAFSKLSRLACMKMNGVTFLANGIGDLDGDQVLIISEGAVFQFPLDG